MSHIIKDVDSGIGLVLYTMSGKPELGEPCSIVQIMGEDKVQIHGVVPGFFIQLVNRKQIEHAHAVLSEVLGVTSPFSHN